jgi:hypothetical protein
LTGDDCKIAAIRVATCSITVHQVGNLGLEKVFLRSPGEPDASREQDMLSGFVQLHSRAGRPQ